MGSAVRSATVPALVMTVAVLGWLGLLVQRSSAEPVLLAGAVARFVPIDAHREPVRSRGDAAAAGPAQVEHSRFTGAETLAVPPAALGLTDRHPRGTSYWREVLGGSGPARLRLLVLDADGARLETQSWGRFGVALKPGLRVLPASLADGSQWSSTGLAASSGREWAYTNQSSARAGDEPGCLQVDSRTTLTTGQLTRGWRELSTWCPGRGVVAQSGETDLPGAPPRWGYAPAEAVGDTVTAPAPRPLPADAGAIRLRELSTLVPDGSFGDTAQPPFSHRPPVLTDDGVLATTQSYLDDVHCFAPGADGRHRQVGWLRPGGKVLTLTSVGEHLAITTSTRELLLYRPTGQLVWRASLDDVAVVEPIPLPQGLLVATLGGQVELRSLTDGEPLWQRQLPNGVGQRLVAEPRTVAVVDNENQLRVLDTRDGAQRWDHPLGGPARGLLVTPERVVAASGRQVRAWSSDSGASDWEVTLPGPADQLVAGQGALAAVVDAPALVLLDPANGRVRRQLPGVGAAVATPDGWVLHRSGRLELVTVAGDSRGGWPVPVLTRPHLVAGPGQAWLFQWERVVTVRGHRLEAR